MARTRGILGYELVLLILGCAVTTGISVVLYRHTVGILENSLRQRLEAIVRTAAPLLDPRDLDELREESDWRRPAWAKVVHQLERIRRNNPQILFVYVFRRTARDPARLEFVADSHSINPYARIDLNGDGRIDDADQLQWPGQPYEEPPATAYRGFASIVTSNLYTDQWGTELSGYAPIQDASGQTIAVLAVDIKADDFQVLTRQTLGPFLAFIAALVLIILFLGAATAIIWQKRLRELSEIDRQKDELLGIVSHQLGSPIASVRWGLQDMLDGTFGAPAAAAKQHLQELKQTTEGLTDLTNLLLDVSRIELGRLQMKKQPGNLAEFFQDIVRVIERKAQEKQVHFAYSLPAASAAGAFDQRLTRMTIENLLTNAVKYTPAGGAVELRAELRGHVLVCVVTDTGIGIPKKDAAKIFGKLYRASNVDRAEGNGFGLYVAKGAIEQQGGTIAFRSAEGQGTTFTVQLPV